MAERLDAWRYRSLALSVGFTLVAGLAYCLKLGSQVRYADEADYLRLSQHLAANGMYSQDGVNPSAFRPPGYPYLLGLVREIWSSVTLLRSLNVLFAAVVVVGVWWLARRIGGNAAATLAAPVMALYPIAFYTMGALYPQTMGAALFIAGLVALVQVYDGRHTTACTIGCGLAFGLLVVTIPTFALALGVSVVWLAVTRRTLLVPLAILLLAAVPAVGWAVRNQVVMHELIPMSTNNGVNLLLGNSEHAGPRSGVNVDLSSYYDSIDRQQLDEVQTDRALRGDAIDWIKANPGRASVLYAEKTLNYFAPFDELATGSENSGAQRLLGLVTYLPLLVLFVIRLLSWRRYRFDPVETLLVLLYVLAAPAQAIFFTRVRFRVPFDPLLIVVVAAFAAHWLESRSTERSPEPGLVSSP